MTIIQELISEFEEIKKTKCKTLQEVIFFDGVLAIIEGKYLEKEKEQDKNKYNEDEVMEMFHNLSMHLPLHYEFLVKEQFKNK